MPRHERLVRLPVDPAEGSHLSGTGGRFREGLHVIVRKDAVSAWIPAGSATSPPKFVGRIERRPDQTMVTGTIYEARFEQFNALFWAVPAAIMLPIAAGSIVAVARHARAGIASLLFALVFAFLFAVLSVSNQRGRARSFDRRAHDLEFSLSRWADPRP